MASRVRQALGLVRSLEDAKCPRMMTRRSAWILPLVCLVAACSSDDATDQNAGGSSGSANVAGSMNGGGTGGTSVGGAPNFGAVGTGPVSCSGVSGDSCPAGMICCERFPSAANTCVASFAACDAEPLACDDPSDCPGQKCCAQRLNFTGISKYAGSGCKSSCTTGTDRVVCATNADCAAAEPTCQQSAESFMGCF